MNNELLENFKENKIRCLFLNLHEVNPNLLNFVKQFGIQLVEYLEEEEEKASQTINIIAVKKGRTFYVYCYIANACYGLCDL